jgi:uncharacterized protein YdcH (DUF465 family)
MATNNSALRKSLANEDSEFGELYNSHKQLENLLDGYNDRPHLSSTEEQKVAELKKKKLVLKDQMQVMMQGHRS